MRTLVAGLLVGLGFTLSACTPPTPAPADAITFQVVPVPMVGGFCAYFAEDQPGKPCLEGMEKVLSSRPELSRDAGSSSRVEITARVNKTLAKRTNSANPPQETTLTVWQIGEVYAARRVN